MGTTAQDQNTQLRVGDEVNPRQRTLVIGNLTRWRAEGRNVVGSQDIEFRDLGLLTQTNIAALSPTLILSPLMDADFDVLDVAEKLTSFGYTGRYRAITEDIPNAELVRREVRAHSPNLDFDLLVMPPVANYG